MLQRLLYPWHLPPYGLPNTQAFSWKPNELASELLLLPDQVRRIVESIRTEWMFDFSCAVARQLRQVGARLDDHLSPSGAVLIANDRPSVSPVASAHAYLMSLAQPAAFEMAGLMMDSPPAEKCAATTSFQEITGVAFFAECASKRASGQRLSHTMRQVAFETAQRCSAQSFTAADISFTHSRPLQARSPIEGQGSMPVAAYRIRFNGCSTEAILQALADAIQSLPPAHSVNEKSDVMVLSNLWTTATA